MSLKLINNNNKVGLIKHKHKQTKKLTPKTKTSKTWDYPAYPNTFDKSAQSTPRNNQLDIIPKTGDWTVTVT